MEKAWNWEKARNRCGEGQEHKCRRPGKDKKKARTRCGEGQEQMNRRPENKTSIGLRKGQQKMKASN